MAFMRLGRAAMDAGKDASENGGQKKPGQMAPEQQRQEENGDAAA
jgi:hypothetical protein